MNRYFLKVDGEQDCADGFGKSSEKRQWEGGEITLPKPGPVLACKGKRERAPEIQPGDELWIWTHESKKYGGGRGLSAKATAAEFFDTDKGRTVKLKNVEIIQIEGDLKYGPLPKNDAGKLESGSRLIDYTYTQTGSAAYLIEDKDYKDFLSVVEQHGWGSNVIDARNAESVDDIESGLSDGWEREILNEDDPLAAPQDRTTTTQIPRPGQAKFREDLMKQSGGRCVVSNCDVPEALEAAHVMPHTGDPKRDHPANGMMLRRDLHAMFDEKLWSIDPESNKMCMAERLKDSYGKFDGLEIDHQVAPILLQDHFRKFNKSGSDD